MRDRTEAGAECLNVVLRMRVGGLAEYILRNNFDMIGPCTAIFGTVGYATTRNVELRAGYVDTGGPHLMVLRRDAIDSEKSALSAKVVAPGPF